MHATRIRHGALTLLIATAMPLTACGGSETGGGGSNDPPTGTTAQDGDGGNDAEEDKGGDDRAQSDIEHNENDTESDIERQVSETLSDLDAETHDGDTVITLPDRVLFDTDEDTLRSDAEATLDDVAEAVAHFEDAPVTVAGHTDSEGSKTYNQELSERRAESVTDHLGEAGGEDGRITAEGHGEADPVASNDDKDGRAENRRVEVVIEGVDLDAEQED